METYRSGHNENDSKSFDRWWAGPWVRIPPAPPKEKETPNGVSFSFGIGIDAGGIRKERINSPVDCLSDRGRIPPAPPSKKPLLSTGTREVSLMFHKPGYGTVFAGYGAFEFCFLLLLAFQFLFCLVSHLRQHSSEEERMSVAEAQRYRCGERRIDNEFPGPYVLCKACSNFTGISLKLLRNHQTWCGFRVCQRRMK